MEQGDVKFPSLAKFNMTAVHSPHILISIPQLLLTTYFLAAFPNPQEPTFLHTSLASLSATSKSWSIYPDNYYPGGGYATFLSGRVCTMHRLADRMLTRPIGQILGNRS